METTDGRVAAMRYTLTSDDGDVIDKSATDAPLSYLHGAGNIVPGLEKALAGKQVGDNPKADVPPEQGHGPRHDGMIRQVPRSAFPHVEVQAGMQFEAHTERGRVLVTVTGIDEENVTVDGNNPLAGKTVHFAVEVANVREATEQEANNCHVQTAA